MAHEMADILNHCQLKRQGLLTAGLFIVARGKYGLSKQACAVKFGRIKL